MSWPQIVYVVAGYLIGSIGFTRVVARVLVPRAELSPTVMNVEGNSEAWGFRGLSATTLMSRVGAR